MLHCKQKLKREDDIYAKAIQYFKSTYEDARAYAEEHGVKQGRVAEKREALVETVRELAEIEAEFREALFVRD
ncbi:Ish1 domain-containing protein [Tumebacillus flagellatus]|uniref:Uncharacterized protein n=1 Tax=Tumebacillus flagellatus TaxID=1157490 RepID=A0A074LUE9_9BACL|nr:Ish1 domain-containing protein [Tumebacillus flagellatus]KEO83558.1 hypothetical protein EL26_09080 [Tumebacillus flagellatus]